MAILALNKVDFPELEELKEGMTYSIEFEVSIEEEHPELMVLEAEIKDISKTSKEGIENMLNGFSKKAISKDGSIFVKQVHSPTN